jgi:hypothetical protein
MTIAGTPVKSRARCRISSATILTEMKSSRIQFIKTICLVTSTAIFGLAGCGKEAGPPPPLAVEQIPAEMQKAFNNSAPEARDAMSRLVSALQNKDYPAAYQEIQTLCVLPGESKEQRALAARAQLTITGLLQTAQAQGDEKAADALRLRQTTR